MGTAGKPVVKSWVELMARLNPSPADTAKTALLLGNGFSIAIYDKFHYKTLKEKTSLADEKLKLFEHLGSSDFERVLALLDDVKAALPNKFEEVESEFKSLHTEIQKALLSAVKTVHPEHVRVNEPVRAVNYELRKFAEVYTVNYDLLLYWAMNALHICDFVDFFYSGNNNEFQTSPKLCLPDHQDAPYNGRKWQKARLFFLSIASDRRCNQLSRPLLCNTPNHPFQKLREVLPTNTAPAVRREVRV